MGRIRAGAPVTGTVVNAGSDNDLTDPRIIVFDPPVRPCLVKNHNTNERVLIKINVEPPDSDGTVTEDFQAANGAGHMDVPPTTVANTDRGTVDASLNGLITVHSISIATTNAGDDLDSVSVVGWPM